MPALFRVRLDASAFSPTLSTGDSPPSPHANLTEPFTQADFLPALTGVFFVAPKNKVFFRFIKL